MIITIACLFTFCAGYILGTTIRNAGFVNMPWHVLKWDRNLLAYRTVAHDYEIQLSDKIMMSLELDTKLVDIPNKKS